MMLEAQAVGEALGRALRRSTSTRRIDGAAEVGAHKTSMLQDLERGRPMEIDALVGAVRSWAGCVGPDADDRHGAGARAPARAG